MAVQEVELNDEMSAEDLLAAANKIKKQLKTSETKVVKTIERYKLKFKEL